jgi:DNA transformation protein
MTKARIPVPIGSLPNIGPTTAGWLESIGIRTEDDLAKLGAVKAYRRLKAAHPKRVTLNALYAMHGALLGIPWNVLPEEMKDELKRQIE